jgi:hypothetical protein
VDISLMSLTCLLHFVQNRVRSSPRISSQDTVHGVGIVTVSRTVSAMGIVGFLDNSVYELLRPHLMADTTMSKKFPAKVHEKDKSFSQIGANSFNLFV